MADNVEANSGSGGAVFATDDIGGIHFPRSKIVIGDNNTNDGDVSAANPLPVTGIITAVTAISNALPAGDNNVGNVDIVTVPAPLSTTGSGTEATALRVTVATDSTGVLSVDDNGGALTVDNGGTFVVQVDAAIPAGTNNIGDVDVATIAAGDNNIGNVDIASIAAGDNNIGNVDIVTVPAPLSTAGGGTEATALRVTVASDSTGVLSVDDNGGALTVDNGGTFAVQETGTGYAIFRSLDLDETEEEVKATAGTVYGMWVTNTATTTRFLKFYNATAANVTVGTTTPVLTIGIPGNATDDIAGNFGPGGLGIPFSTAITVAVTTAAADADTGAPGAGDVIVNIFYK